VTWILLAVIKRWEQYHQQIHKTIVLKNVKISRQSSWGKKIIKSHLKQFG